MIDVLPRSASHFRVEFEYDAIETLTVARQVPDAFAVLEGDYGGQTYVAAPARLVRCDENVLRQLLQDIDVLVWDDSSGQQLSYQKQKIGTRFGGGMGGAEATGDIWIHGKILELGIGDHIRKVILGEKPNLGLPADTVNQIKQARADRISRLASKFEPDR